VVDEAVVVRAQERKVVDVGSAAVAPPHDVVGVAAEVPGVAAGELARAARAGDEGAQHGGGDETAGAAHVEGLAVVVGDGEGDVGPFHQLS
jgi:hypothetical protein